MTRIAFILALLAAPAFAGGPVLVDPEVPVASPRDRDNALPLILLGIVVAGIVLGGSDNCNDAPQPAPGGC